MSRQHRKPKFEGDIRVVELAAYTSPKIIEDPRKDFVMYGEDNNYYQYLIDIYNGSPTNHACINGISEMIFGKGLDATDSDKKPDQYAQMISLLKEDVIRKVIYDYYLMGGAAMQIIYGKGRKKIVQIEHIPVDYYLSGIKTPVTTEYLQSNNNYICRCKNSASSCVFHKFLIEKLYNKYKKDVYAKNSNFYDDNDDVWSLG